MSTQNLKSGGPYPTSTKNCSFSKGLCQLSTSTYCLGKTIYGMGSLSAICEPNDPQFITSIVLPKSSTSCEVDLIEPNYPIESLEQDAIETNYTREYLNNSSENYIIPCIPRDSNIPSYILEKNTSLCKPKLYISPPLARTA